ncbi:MAG: hypothetical protein JSV66_08280 [Trueperaceae bacterium]|nr:MAG: hypothetical protein JSV66_08280 [Trueperaceae bacterium]
MSFISDLNVRPDASRTRLRALDEQLKSYHCQVRFDQRTRRLEFEVPDEQSWMNTGRITALLFTYGDVIDWEQHFHDGPASPAKEVKQLA